MSPRSPDETLRAMEVVMGELPRPERIVPPDVSTESECSRSGIAYRKIRFATETGDRCWAWVLSAEDGDRDGPRPGMLCLHQTIRDGKDEPVGLAGRPALHYALELARRGTITLTPDYPGFGEYRVDPYTMGYASATMKGIWNHMRAIDVLEQLPGVDPARLGAIGHSLGGHNALFVAAFDVRIGAAVSSSGFTRFTWNDNEGRGLRGDLSDWSHAGYMPRIRERYACRAEGMPFDFPDVLAAIAPRPVFINAPLQDVMRYEGVDECAELVRPLYESHGASDSLVVRHPDCGHEFPDDVRHDAYAWLDGWLKRG